MNVSSASMTTRIDPDGALVAALRRGDPTAAEDLVAAWGNRAYHLAWRITTSAPDCRGSRARRLPVGDPEDRCVS